MYKTANFNGIMEKIMNCQMVYYVGQLTKDILIANDFTLYPELESYFDYKTSNADTALEALSKYKSFFDKGFPYLTEYFPIGKTKKEAYKLLIKTFEFLKDPEPKVPDLEIEFMIGISLLEALEEAEYLSEQIKYLEEEDIASFEDFVETEDYLITRIKSIYPLSEDEEKDLRTDIKKCVESFGLESKEAYSYIFEMLTCADKILDLSFYDTDFLLLQEHSLEALKILDKVNELNIFLNDSEE